MAAKNAKMSEEEEEEESYSYRREFLLNLNFFYQNNQYPTKSMNPIFGRNI